MKAPEDFVLDCANIFTEQEHSLLMRFGCWMTALATGMISLITPAEERFLAVGRDDVEAETVLGVAWAKLKARRHFEEQGIRRRRMVSSSRALAIPT